MRESVRVSLALGAHFGPVWMENRREESEEMRSCGGGGGGGTEPSSRGLEDVVGSLHLIPGVMGNH